MCVNNLPKVVTRQCLGAESNLRPWVTSGLQVRHVTVRLPSHTFCMWHSVNCKIVMKMFCFCLWQVHTHLALATRRLSATTCAVVLPLKSRCPKPSSLWVAFYHFVLIIIDRVIHWLVGSLVDCQLMSWFSQSFDYSMEEWSTETWSILSGSINRTISWSTYGFISWLIGSFIRWFVGRLIDLSMNWWMDWKVISTPRLHAASCFFHLQHLESLGEPSWILRVFEFDGRRSWMFLNFSFSKSPWLRCGIFYILLETPNIMWVGFCQFGSDCAYPWRAGQAEFPLGFIVFSWCIYLYLYVHMFVGNCLFEPEILLTDFAKINEFLLVALGDGQVELTQCLVYLFEFVSRHHSVSFQLSQSFCLLTLLRA